MQGSHAQAWPSSRPAYSPGHTRPHQDTRAQRDEVPVSPEARLLKPADVWNALGCSGETVRRMIRDGRLEAVDLGQPGTPAPARPRVGADRICRGLAHVQPEGAR